MEIFPKVSLVTRLSFTWLRFLSHFLIYNFYIGGYKSGTVHEVAFKNHQYYWLSTDSIWSSLSWKG